MAKADRFSCWAQLPVGAVVQLRKGVLSHHPVVGVVKEKLDDEITGYARYGVLVEQPEFGRANTVDCCRCEMTRVRKGSGPRKRAQRRKVSE